MTNSTLVVPQVIAAFVTFNSYSSVQRCLDDYDGSDSWFRHRFQPTPLCFKGTHPLIVTAAPEPTDLQWENIEVTKEQRGRRVFVVNVLLIVILVLSTLLCIVTQSQQTRFLAAIPSTDLCSVQVPTTWLHSAQFPADVAITRRTDDAARAACASGSLFTLTSASFSSPSQWVAPTDDVTWNSTVPQCGIDALCISLSSPEKCPVPLPGSAAVVTLSTVAECYCNSLMKRSGWAAVVNNGLDTEFCGIYYRNVVLSQALAVLPGIVVVLINIAMRRVLRTLTSFERHLSMTLESSTLTVKLFVAQFLNTALVVLVVKVKTANRCAPACVSPPHLTSVEVYPVVNVRPTSIRFS